MEDFNKFTENTIPEKAILKDNTRLPKNFIEPMIRNASEKIRQGLRRPMEDMDILKIMKEV